MKFEWKTEIDAEIGCHACRLMDDKGDPMNGPEVHLTDYTCPWREEHLKNRLESEPHTSLLLAQAKVAFEWTYCYGVSVTERYMRNEHLTLKDVMALVEEHLTEHYLNKLATARQTVKELSRVEAFAGSRRKTAPFRFSSALEMLETIRSHDLYNPDTNMYIFLYNGAGSIAVYDWIDREEAMELGTKAEDLGDYWGAFLGPGGEIYDDPSYESFDPNNNTSNLQFCEDTFAKGRGYAADGWWESNRSEQNKETERS